MRRVLRIHLLFNLPTTSLYSAYSNCLFSLLNLKSMCSYRKKKKMLEPNSTHPTTHKFSQQVTPLRPSYYFWSKDKRHKKRLNLEFLFSFGAWEKGIKNTFFMFFILCWLCHTIALCPKRYFSISQIAGEGR